MIFVLPIIIIYYFTLRLIEIFLFVQIGPEVTTALGVDGRQLRKRKVKYFLENRKSFHSNLRYP